MKHNTLEIHPVTPEFFNQISKLNKWHTSRLLPGQAVEKHRHSFDAMYFVSGVKEVCSGIKRIALPQFAAVFVPKGTEHGWNGVSPENTQAFVGHFHEGHGPHDIVTEY